MLLPNPLLAIDTRRAAESITKYIKKIVTDESAKGVVIALNGSVDSAVLATLAIHALGKKAVEVYYLYDRHSPAKSMQKALLWAHRFSLNLKIFDIEPVMRRKLVYKPLIMKITAYSGLINRILAKAYTLVYHQSPFISTLQLQDSSGSDLYPAYIRHLASACNTTNIYRREFLQKLAKEHNMIVLGTTNRSDFFIGWFVKDGISDMPYSPLGRLYKTQIRQLAQFLKLPAAISDQNPSSDMIKGITDEFVIGISYDDLDIILDGLNRHLDDNQIIQQGQTIQQIKNVQMMNQLSKWKRRSKHHRPPVGGTIKAGLRLYSKSWLTKSAPF
ncbi:NAD(+) synthase [Planctomycetota bacterium]